MLPVIESAQRKKNAPHMWNFKCTWGFSQYGMVGDPLCAHSFAILQSCLIYTNDYALLFRTSQHTLLKLPESCFHYATNSHVEATAAPRDRRGAMRNSEHIQRR